MRQIITRVIMPAWPRRLTTLLCFTWMVWFRRCRLAGVRYFIISSEAAAGKICLVGKMRREIDLRRIGQVE